MKKALFFLLISIVLFSPDSFCQEENLNPELLAWYQQTLPFFQDVITGGQYADAPATYLGSPFYGSGKVENGQVWINGLGYDKVPLLYDVWLDEVLTIHPRYNQKILIKAGKIEKFVLADSSEFIRIDNNPGYAKHNQGFYQLISDGEPKLLKKNYRKVEAVNETGLITRKFTVERDYFFWFKDEFWKVANKTDGAVALGLSTKEVKKHFKGKGMVFKKDPESVLMELLQLRSQSGAEFNRFPAR